MDILELGAASSYHTFFVCTWYNLPLLSGSVSDQAINPLLVYKTAGALIV